MDLLELKAELEKISRLTKHGKINKADLQKELTDYKELLSKAESLVDNAKEQLDRIMINLGKYSEFSFILREQCKSYEELISLLDKIEE